MTYAAANFIKRKRLMPATSVAGIINHIFNPHSPSHFLHDRVLESRFFAVRRRAKRRSVFAQGHIEILAVRMAATFAAATIVAVVAGGFFRLRAGICFKPRLELRLSAKCCGLDVAFFAAGFSWRGAVDQSPSGANAAVALADAGNFVGMSHGFARVAAARRHRAKSARKAKPIEAATSNCNRVAGNRRRISARWRFRVRVPAAGQSSISMRANLGRQRAVASGFVCLCRLCPRLRQRFKRARFRKATRFRCVRH